MKKVGIIGFGSFGKFLTEKLAPFCQVLVYSKEGDVSPLSASLAEVARADFVILAIPIEAYKSVLVELKPLLATHTVIVDVCSVKTVPVALVQKLLPGQKLLATHPLFGPESAAHSFVGQTLVICPEVSDKAAMTLVARYAPQLGIEIKLMDTHEHDREMATVQGLTFFIARVLKNYGLHELALSTPSFQRLLHLAELERQHSDELFFTIQRGNPETTKARRKFLQAAEALARDIEAQNENEVQTPHHRQKLKDKEKP